MNTGERIVFIGAGNMTEALVKGLRNASVSADLITVTDIRPERLAHFRDTYGVNGSRENGLAAKGADIVVLAVKPQQMAEALVSLRGIAPHALFVSIAAGVPTARIERELGGTPRVVRVMPNTPALVGAGVSALSAGAFAGKDDLARADKLLRAVGRTVHVAERKIDAITAVSGSGPAYIFFVMEAMEAAAIELGLQAEVARELVLATFTGSAKLAQESGQSPGVLRQQVTSKGGTTEAALNVLQARDVAGAFSAALAAAARRAHELASGG